MDYDDMKKPNVIFFPHDENEVLCAVKCVHDNDALLCACSEGHSYVGDSVCDGMIIDMGSLKK